MTDKRFEEHNIAAEETRSYVYTDGYEYEIYEPKKLFITTSGSHRILDADGGVHYPKSDWRAIRWTPKDIKNPVQF
jgi:hypothetical protein